MIRTNRSVALGSICLIVAGVEYFVTEAITASAWRDPLYSYARNYVSDLGVTGPRETFLGHNILSPLAGVMNTGFVLNGLLVLAGVILITRFRGHARARVLWILALLFAVGITMVGTFHGSLLSQKAGTLAFHFGGAPIAIICGNVIAIVAGLSFRHPETGTWFPPVMVTLGIGGILGLVAEILVIGGAPAFPAGIFERVAVYCILASQLLWGAALLAHCGRKSGRI
ncbi:MAG TPA: DUF998 domain-containing protein [Galbitalea sp.]|jgi:hypothetical membrane protein|nr:DUF998 domain-containing protein [Galbitalea sp.]